MRLAAYAILLASAILSLRPALASQAPSLPLPVPMPSAPATDVVHAYQIKRVGSFDVAPLSFQNVRLFDVTAPAPQDSNAIPPVAARIDVIQENLREVLPPPSTFGDIFTPLRARYNPDTFLVKVQVSNGYWTLIATDATSSTETPLLTVTELDAKYNGVTQEQLAQSWADVLQAVLGEALRQRAPGALEKQLTNAALGLLVAILLTLVIIGMRIGLSRLRATLPVPVAAEDAQQAAGGAADARTSWWRHALRITLAVLDWLLAWSTAVLWAVAVLWALLQIGPTQPFARKLAGQLTAVLLIWFVISIVNRLGSVAINRFAHMWKVRPFGSADEGARRRARSATIKSSFEYAKTTSLYIIGAALTLSALGTSSSAVVTLGAAVAFAVSFGAQSLVKDFVNGFFILAEDQYAIGDFVTIGAVRGIVCEVTLRITQLRSDDGRMVTIPNSQVAVVENWTRDYSRVDYRIAVAFDADIEGALRVFGDVLTEVARDQKWRRQITGPPVVLGVESVSSAGAVLLGQIRTAPGVMFELSRELNRRMLEAFTKAGVGFGTPASRAIPSTPDSATPQSTGATQERVTGAP